MNLVLVTILFNKIPQLDSILKFLLIHSAKNISLANQPEKFLLKDWVLSQIVIPYLKFWQGDDLFE